MSDFRWCKTPALKISYLQVDLPGLGVMRIVESDVHGFIVLFEKDHRLGLLKANAQDGSPIGAARNHFSSTRLLQEEESSLLPWQRRYKTRRHRCAAPSEIRRVFLITVWSLSLRGLVIDSALISSAKLGEKRKIAPLLKQNSDFEAERTIIIRTG